MARQTGPNGERPKPLLHQDQNLATPDPPPQQLLPMKELTSAINHPLAAGKGPGWVFGLHAREEQ